MRYLAPSAKLLFFLDYLFVFVFFGFLFLVCPLPYLLNVSSELRSSYSILIFLCSILTFFVTAIILSYVIAELCYKNYKYDFRSEGFYKEYGLITKKYITVPYNKIQNIDIHRGIFARLLGLSILKIQTAGISGSSLYEANLPGVGIQEAEWIRSELLRRQQS